MSFLEAAGNRLKMKQALNEKWKELFEIEEDVDDDLSFFDIGGNSLTAGILFSDIESQLDIKMNVGDIYDHDTIDSLSSYIVTCLGKH